MTQCSKYISQWLFCIIFAALSLSGSLAVAQSGGNADPRDALVLQAADAYKKNDIQKLQTILPQVAGHPMEPWVDYWSIRSRLGQASPEEIMAFFQRWPGSYVEDRLRNDWLLQLGKRQQWDLFSQQYPMFRMRDDSQVLCYALLIDHRNGHNAVSQAREEFIQIRPAYVSEDGCNMMASVLYRAGKMPAADIWIKARRLVEVNRVASTQKTVALLSTEFDNAIKVLMDKPDQWLHSQKGSDASKVVAGPMQSELVTLALIRWAAKDPNAAVAALRNDWKDTLNADQSGWVYAVAGRVLAQRLDSKALDYYKQASGAKGLSDDVLNWHARAQLRAAASSRDTQGWKRLVTLIDSMPENLRTDATWVYWKAIGLRHLAGQHAGHENHQQANAMLESIAGYDGFYEQLATEELGRKIMLPAQPQSPTEQEMNAAIETPGLMRALYAIRMGLRSEGLREWNWNLIGKNDRQLQAAAQLACDQHVWDRCVNTSERAKGLFNVSQRFPMPYKDLVMPRTNEIGLDPSYVFGLMRQESRFIADIQSSAGASGLMQLMPATARWTAKEIGMTDFKPALVTDPKVNITLGTAYLKLSVDEFDGSELLAAAGYNAGPNRPRRWRNGPALDGAVWAENVPFNETRAYVKTVLSAAVVYQMVLTGQPQSLRDRLGQVKPHDPSVPDKTPDLP